ncbi:MAG TPA: ABC transporter ATP-binding protein [Gammaproteobacteria bacterium]
MLLDIRGLNVGFRQQDRVVPAVNRLDIQLARNEILAVVGESGAGKSQAFLALTRLVAENAVVSGEAWLDGRNLLALDDEALRGVRGSRIAYVFQDAMTALNPYLRIGTQLVEVLKRHRGLKGKAARAAAGEMLELVRIPEPATRMKQYPHQLSGGQRQRVMLAMALLGRPEILIADEPTTALDVTVQRRILDLLKDLQKDLGFSLIFITHDLGVVARIAQRVAVMYAGSVVEIATVQELFDDPRHRYTRGLLAAAPRLHGGIPRPIAGQPPKPDRLPAGCAFAPRCGDIMNRCQQPLPWLEISPTHFVACHAEVKRD